MANTAFAFASRQRLRPLSYSKSHIILIAFSLDTPDSLENVQVKWIEEVREICGPNVPVMLIGLKKDLRDDAEAANPGQPLNPNRYVSRERVGLVSFQRTLFLARLAGICSIPRGRC